MTEYDYDIGVIGGGAAGLTVASGASQLGMKTLLVEKEPKLGGDCLHYGCVPSKTLIRSASVYHQIRNARQYGLPDLKLPPVNISQINARIQSVIDFIQNHDSEERFCNLGVKVFFGDAEFMDEHVIECGGKRFSAKYWVLATGSAPLGLPVPGLEEAGYLTNRDIFSLEDLPSSLVIIGGGPVGCEMAQSFSRLGSEVTIIHRSCQILTAEDQDMAEVVQDALKSEGVKLALCAATQEVRKVAGGIEAVYMCDGKVHRKVACCGWKGAECSRIEP